MREITIQHNEDSYKEEMCDYRNYDTLCMKWLTARISEYNEMYRDSYEVIGRFSKYDMEDEMTGCSGWIGVHYYIRSDSNSNISRLQEFLRPIELEIGHELIEDGGEDEDISLADQEIIKKCVAVWIDEYEFRRIAEIYK